MEYQKCPMQNKTIEKQTYCERASCINNGLFGASEEYGGVCITSGQIGDNLLEKLDAKNKSLKEGIGSLLDKMQTAQGF